MKSALIAAALAATLSIPALAQDTTQTTTAGSMPAAGDPSAQAPAADTMQPPAGGTMPAPADSMTPSSTMPASGSSMPAASTPAPMGSSSGGAMASSPGMMASAPPAGDPSTYPVCSKTVQDRCINRDAAHKKKG